MRLRLRWCAFTALAVPLVCGGCRCGHERAIPEQKQTAPATKAGEAKGEASPAIETWDTSLSLIPESSLQVVDEIEEATPPRSAADELWVVVRRAEPVTAPRARLGASAEERQKSQARRDREGPQPISIASTVTGFVASVHIRHMLLNTSPDTADFVYELPLPDDASVREFTVAMGPRTIRGVIREREEALSIYRLARSRGLVTSLIDLDHTSTLRNAIDNVAPGTALELTFSYCMALSYVDNAFELRIPLNLAATASPGGTGEGAALPSRLTDRAPIDLKVDVDMGMPLDLVISPTHHVAVERSAPHRAAVEVVGPITTADAAFVLRCAVRVTEPTAAAFAHRDPTGDYVGILLVSPPHSPPLPRRPLEVLFLLDCSESMRGAAMSTVTQMVEAGLGALDSLDACALITSDGTVVTGGLLPGTPENLARASELIRGLLPTRVEGMVEGLRAALALPHEEGRLRVVLLMTDGRVDEDFGAAARLIDRSDARFFCLCTGTTANRLLLEALAVEGRGGVAYFRPGAASSDAVRRLMAALHHPVLTEITIALPGCTEIQMMPARVPDLLRARPVTLIARCGPTTPSRLAMRGVGPEGVWSKELPVPPAQPSDPAFATIWARRQLGGLIRQAMVDTSASLDGAIRDHAVRWGLLSPHTSFLTIDTAG